MYIYIHTHTMPLTYNNMHTINDIKHIIKTIILQNKQLLLYKHDSSMKLLVCNLISEMASFSTLHVDYV